MQIECCIYIQIWGGCQQGEVILPLWRVVIRGAISLDRMSAERAVSFIEWGLPRRYGANGAKMTILWISLFCAVCERDFQRESAHQIGKAKTDENVSLEQAWCFYM